ncbi:protein kinase subdomain-containing protein PKL/ccin4 [Coprinopsis cinerea okayama7|uniref:Protein kinase subdomain-containing protein PKL/ccin4 n=1 Tax=Coprinopsis cinerea (strain Okayama-7 / 130 / ATCC MYA-4618 / FGSC 9003) TaxID=240176 RepID=A8NDF9_COPC7|nr:protein kinase subdomain-containing protein PKL/ccin4 [Coprinopsis cinerea okayama7\|eukprot:XP_001832762.2 protein kinase subdomain-containing protein PKL/ccin4 [Coprinopsis cinerea okayama7\
MSSIPVASDSIPENTSPAPAPPQTTSPIHEFIPTDIPDIYSPPPVKIGDILHWLANTIVSHLPEPQLEESNPTTPSSHHQTRSYNSRRFKSPNLHLTPKVLNTTVTIRSLESYSNMIIDNYDEQTFTLLIMTPLMNTIVSIFSLAAGATQWLIQPNRSQRYELNKTLELDVVLYHKRCLVTAVEMKTPMCCNDSNITSFRTDKSSSMDKKAKEIHDQVGKQGKYLKGLSPKKPFVLHALSVAPGHLTPIASDGSLRFAIGSDVINVSGSFPDAVRDVRNWLDYIDRLAAFTLAMVCQHDEDAAKEIGSRFPEQQKQIDELYAAADGALSPAAATGSKAAVVPSDQQPETDMVWLSLGLELPEASSVYESHENIVYVHSRWGIRLVIKVFGEESSYAKELLSYQRLEKLQGKGIPVLYATGTMNARPCLVLSYEGERLREGPTEEQKATLYPVVKAIHDLDIHHHDLHRRNVVQDSSGKLTLIDFGLSEPCTRKGCEDEWQADEWY